ncbi:hypothetical protein AB1Y20_002360 [Prymnesium parvum]|uniref:Amino acid transporter transmembrane domain-containing protein n=1 Tax=Prymnesium parvum TaxID=97485 RepID=A0AB34J8W9_PRYPA
MDPLTIDPRTSASPLMSSTHDLEAAPPSARPMSTCTAALMLSAFSLGVGVFLMPSVFAQLGLGLGVTLLVLFGLLSTAVAFAITTIADHHAMASMAELVARVPLAPTLSHVFVLITLVTGNASHLQLVASMAFDLMESFVTGDYGAYAFTRAHKAVLLLLFIGAVLPFCLVADLSRLKHMGKLVSATVILTCVALVSNCAYSIAHDGAIGVGPSTANATLPALPADAGTAIRLLPTICFTYTSLFSLFPLRTVLLAKDAARGAAQMRRAVLVAGALQTALYTIVATAAALAFGEEAGATVHGTRQANGNVLYNFAPNDYLITSLSFLLVVVIVLDYPIIQFPAVDAARHLLPRAIGEAPHLQLGATVAFAAAVLALDLFIPDLSDLFGLCGSLGISGYCYIIPGGVIARLGHTRGLQLFGALTCVVGVFILVASTYFIMQHITTNSSS